MLPQFAGDTADSIWRQAAQRLLSGDGVHRQDSRIGPTQELMHCTFVLTDPRQRWVLSRQPAINPAFAIAEVVWILQGRDDSAFLNYWNPGLPQYAGYGERYHGAYGHRLRQNLGFDQLDRVWSTLTQRPDSRQAVLQIWDGARDLPHADGAPQDVDIPCNVCSMPKVRNGRLEWLQVMRSNDLFLGTPHNFVQFTTLQEVFAGWLGVEPGLYVQVSDSLHVYEKNLTTMDIGAEPAPVFPTTPLALPKPQFDWMLPELGRSMDELRADKLTRPRFAQMVRGSNLPEGWANMLRIAAADAARRRGWLDEAAEAATGCTDPALAAAWTAWEKRKG